MKIYTDIEQQSEEWFKMRMGKMTASHATAIGNCGKGLNTYLEEMMSEYFSFADKEHYSNEHTDRGNELESQARMIYELEKGVEVQQVSFIEYNEYIGCSPDGIIGEDGGLEIKCPSDKNHFKMILRGESEIDSGYIWQVQMNLWITKREWWDLCFYNPNYEKSMIIFRIFPDKEKFSKLEAGFDIGTKMIEEINEKLCPKK